ncbi:MAG: helicase-related protein [Desulfosalsimonadaceae bacterium]
MEKIRQDNGGMGETPFSIGIWVGSANTPNSCQQAHAALNRMRNHRNAENPFLLRQCPWCGSEMGSKYIRGQIHILGYSSTGNSVVFKCPDRRCPFHDNLPIHVIDEEIYKQRPSLIIGTVDKFAMLAWVPESGSLFGLDRNGEREKKPPGLIIQDELHLISGPLGTMVGLYETVIEELCSEKIGETVLKPKIICSTATIRRYKDQIKALFARKNVFLFPPPGLDDSDSFFARYAADENGKPLPGRRYLGVYAPGLSSLQTLQVRVFAALLMGVTKYEKNEERDPWWTLMIFFNSLRELGGALSLFQTDIPGMVKAVAARNGLPTWRRLDYILELTSRMNNEEVPLALEELAKKYRGNRSRAIDVCLASSIIEVGIDVDRLSLMSIVGQPKTVSQYIQVSGRIGRQWQERPGLVLTLFSSTKPRDRSFFEKFQSTHSQLYAQVEPTSVTPFSPPVIDRALHALFAIYLRLFGDTQAAENPQCVNPELISSLKMIIKTRVKFIDSSEIDYVITIFEKRLRQFNRWQRAWWYRQQQPGDSLLRRYETWVTEKIERTSWATPTSMRNVDAECQMDITTLYNQQEEDN